MSKLIVIFEKCEEETQACGFDYDLLPEKVKEKVDKALESKFKSCGVNTYKNGLQYLYNIKHPQLENNSNVEFMGIVTFYDIDYK